MDIVERAAHAIWQEKHKRHGSIMMTWQATPEREDYMAYARAALTASKEALPPEPQKPERDIEELMVEWRKMMDRKKALKFNEYIDAALKP